MKKRKMERTDILLLAVNAALAAGKRILEIYNQPQESWQVEQKADHSPLTLADRQANDIIVKALSPVGIPVLSEETRLTDYQERSRWQQLWIVDPLDGTKEFIKRNGEFTVNIALVEQGSPVFGVVYAPAQGKLYVGRCGQGAWRLEVDADTVLPDWSAVLENGRSLPLEPDAAAGKKTRIVVSRSHLDEHTLQFIARLEAEGRQVETVASGSSLKICLLAEGSADLYPRFAPTSEWDTAAGDGVLRAVGGVLHEVETGAPLRYNKENILNPFFMGGAAQE